jgi:ABC-2 type transport system ATP-binding protein
MLAIETQDLCKTYRGKRGKQVNALKNLSMSINNGEIFGFLGPNGAGKSTTIKTLMGLAFPTSGTARILGQDIAKASARDKVGYLPENPAFYDYLSAEEYLCFVARVFCLSGPEIARRMEGLLKKLDLWEARKRAIKTYSKGMVQRVGIAQVLIHDPEVYILDEPMSGLDPIGRVLVKEIILELKSRGRCVFFSTHITADVEKVCDRVGIILDGELKTVARVADILAEGITGYTVHSRGTNGTEIMETDVPQEKLAAFLSGMHDKGKEINLVEPKLKSLEDFFLDIVSKK